MRKGIPFLLAAALAYGCTPATEEDVEPAGEALSEAPAAAGADEDAIRAVVEDFDAALNARDIEAFMALFVAEPTSLPPDHAPVVGAQAFRALWQGLIDQGELQVDNQASEIRIDGDLAVARGTYTLTVTPAVGEATSEFGWWTGVWRRQADGGWKGEWNAWGTERPTAAPAS